MAIPGLDVGRGTEADLDGIMELQAANQLERGGMLSAALSRSQVTEMVRARPLIVARRSGRIVAFLMNGTREMNEDVAIIRAMLDAYPGALAHMSMAPYACRKKNVAKDWLRPCSRNYGVCSQAGKAFFSSGVTIQRRCARTRRWACAR